MEIIYVALAVIIALMYVCTLKYNRKKIGNKYNFLSGLKPLDGMSMMIVDWCVRLFKGRKGKVNGNGEKLKKLYVKDNVSEMEYVYCVRKTSLSIIIFTLFIVTGFFATMNNSQDNVKDIREVSRPGYGTGQKELEILAEVDDEEETLHLKVDERKYTEEEINNIFDRYYDDVIKEMLGNNKSEDNILYDLNFCDTYGAENIQLYWELDDEKILDYDGKVYRDDSNHEVKVHLTMSLEGCEKKYDVMLIIQAEKNEDKSLQDKVQEYIDGEDSYRKSVNLPEKVDGKTVIYKESQGEENIPFLLLGLIVAVAVFILKDKDMDKELAKRKEQLEDDYAGIVSKMMLLTAAGMTIKNAWFRISDDYVKRERKIEKRYAYEELTLAANKIKSGQSEKEVYRMFGRRCGIQMYIKFGNILEQNIVKGTKGMRGLLEYEVHEAFENRKMLAKKRGDEAGTKMLLPMIIMLAIAIVIIIVPSFLTMERGL